MLHKEVLAQGVLPSISRAGSQTNHVEECVVWLSARPGLISSVKVASHSRTDGKSQGSSTASATEAADPLWQSEQNSHEPDGDGCVKDKTKWGNTTLEPGQT